MNKFESSPVVKQFLRQRRELPGQKDVSVIAGVSGGPDSMALFYLLHRFGIETVVVHCNYQMRGEASDQDQLFVEEICGLWEAECVSVRLDSEEREGQNFQAWARDRRYQIFRDLKKEFQTDYILTAHHRDDQIETILQKILRGSGAASWKGMEPLEGDLFRPLLDVSKAAILEFVEEFNIPYRTDSSNEESDYARNFLRHQWFPEMDRLFPGWRQNLLKIPKRAGEFEAMAGEILERVSENPARLHRKAFLELPSAIQPVVLHRFIRQSGWEAQPAAEVFSGIEQLGQLQTGKSIQLGENCFLMRDREVFVLADSPGGKKHAAGEKGVTIDADTCRAGITIGPVAIAMEKAAGRFNEKSSLSLDAGKIRFPVTVRKWDVGDRFQPFGMKGTQLVSDHLTNRKISSSRKNETKVIESFDGMICAVIFPHKIGNAVGTISEEVRCTPDTRRVLTIRHL